MKVDEYDVPENLCYNRDHLWMLKKKRDLVTIGITDYAQKMLHELIVVYLPNKNKAVKFSEVFGTVESTKAISELYSPFTGEIFEVNEKLRKKPRIINEDPYGEGWIVTIRASNFEEESKKLVKPEQYAEYLRGLIKFDSNLLIHRWREKPPQ